MSLASTQATTCYQASSNMLYILGNLFFSIMIFYFIFYFILTLIWLVSHAELLDT